MRSDCKTVISKTFFFVSDHLDLNEKYLSCVKLWSSVHIYFLLTYCVVQSILVFYQY
jgi:hypothetical protein